MKTLSKYQEFLQSKKRRYMGSGKVVSESEIHPMLFDFQKKVTAWALRKGRAAIFLDTGLGKTFCQIEWARLLNVPTLIVAPLSVARQTVREAKKIDINIKYIRSKNEIDNNTQIYITNYEMIDNVFDSYWKAIVLDESSILKSFDGKTRLKLINLFKNVPYRLACTATPSPNDQVELGNHAEFLGICSQNEMLSEYFIHANLVIEKQYGDIIVREKQSNKKGTEWRLRNYAKNDFYYWLSSWALSMRKPSDLNFNDDGFLLPALNIKPIYIPVDYKPEGMLFFSSLKGIQERGKVRKDTIKPKITKAIEIINNNSEQWIIWCGLNEESKQITPLLNGAVEVKGSDSPEYKAKTIEDFQDGKIRVLVTKPKIAGFGMNFQNAHNMLFLGLSDSWESYYQCIRRQWRFGQVNPVNVYIILSDVERAIYQNVLRKEQIATSLHKELMKFVKNYELKELKGEEKNMPISHETSTYNGNSFKAMLGDSAELLKEINDNSIDLSVYSPPFADLYTYTSSERDLGNSKNWDEFFSHYSFIVKELLRVTKKGRNTCVHTSDIPAMSMKDGYIGIRDFPGAVIKAYEDEGWIFYGRAIVTKNPQSQAIRTKSKALLFTQLRKDSVDSRPALLDHILIFKKPGKVEIPVEPVKNGEIDNEKWIDWAGGIWTGIRESDILKYNQARSEQDEKHICPLQLGTIERCIKLYSNPGETILTPFGGIGSEAYQAIKFGRKAILIELKKSYYDIALQNLIKIDRQQGMDLFSYINNNVI